MCQLNISLTRNAHICLEVHFCVELHTKKPSYSVTILLLKHDFKTPEKQYFKTYKVNKPFVKTKPNHF